MGMALVKKYSDQKGLAQASAHRSSNERAACRRCRRTLLPQSFALTSCATFTTLQWHKRQH